MAPYEYVDMNFGMTLGSYKISYAGLKYLYEEGSENNGSRND